MTVYPRAVSQFGLAAMEDRFFDDHFHILDHFLGLTHQA